MSVIVRFTFLLAATVVSLSGIGAVWLFFPPSGLTVVLAVILAAAGSYPFMAALYDVEEKLAKADEAITHRSGN